jgi:uncharacterized membrane protein AbrB (regulator of aidB expression)
MFSIKNKKILFPILFVVFFSIFSFFIGFCNVAASLINSSLKTVPGAISAVGAVSRTKASNLALVSAMDSLMLNR